ncbi:MAG: DUF2950 domain-containing protein [Bryobacterales bacterium]|nr:DUF2950 domain-containing protein [Bryobacterales bacterium]MBV9401596.1 DUF2950 domain-containing protein [Bryobacterales bacterium]
MAFPRQSRFLFIALASAAAAIAQERFDSPDAAAQALIDAANEHDSARLAAIFGPRATGILKSGNPTEDRNEQTEFARLAREKHRIQISPMNPNRAVLAVGDEDWPFPVPVVRTGGLQGKWSFDASETPAEMRARRIGANELDAIEICHGYVDAQMKYASKERDKNGILLYASRLMSTPGRHDGLYWKGEADPLIPHGLARAESSGTGSLAAYHGYYFRVLVGQGPNAPGGAHNYVANNKLIGGFGLIAWPAQYGVTGVHTFIVNQDGVVYEKDLSPATGQSPATITRFNPDRSWRPAD